MGLAQGPTRTKMIDDYGGEEIAVNPKNIRESKYQPFLHLAHQTLYKNQTSQSYQKKKKNQASHLFTKGNSGDGRT